MRSASLQRLFPWLLTTSEGSGAEAMRRRLERTSQKHYTLVVVHYPETYARIVGDYETLLAERPQTIHRVKPPGPHVIFKGLQDIAKRLPWESKNPGRSITNVGMVLFPIVGALLILPFLALGRRSLSEDGARRAVILLLVTPNFLLMPLMLDQCLHPLLFVGVFLLMWRAFETESPTWGALASATAGALAYLSIFISFAVVGILPAVLALALGIAVCALGTERQTETWKRLAIRGASASVGFLAAHSLFLFVFSYDFLERYQGAVTSHATFKGVSWSAASRLRWGAQNSLEFVTWIGWPLAVLAFWAVVRSVAAVWKRKPTRADMIPFALCAVLVALAWFGKTKAETGRLWLFLVPLVAIAAARELEGRPRLTKVVIALQVATVLAIKRFQDFH